MGKRLIFQFIKDLSGALLSIAIFVALIPIALLICFYRQFVILISRILRPDLDSIVMGADTMFAHPDIQDATSVILICFVVDKVVSEHRLREAFDQRVLGLRDDSGGDLVYKRMFQYWTKFFGFYFWKSDQDFDVRNHVRKFDYNNLCIAVPTDETMVKLVLPKLIEIPWKPHRSHWETLLVDSYKISCSSGSDTKPGSLIIFRFDHALCDGFSILGIFRTVCQSQFRVAQASRTENLSILQMARLVLAFPILMFQLLPINKNPRCLRSRTRNNWVYDVSDNIPISMIKTIRRNNGVSFAAVIHSAVNASICHCIQHNDKLPSDTIDAFTILPHPKHPGGMCNKVKAFTEDFPLRIASSRERLYKTDAILKSAPKDMATIASLHFPKIFEQLPSSVTYRIISFIHETRPSYFISNFSATTSPEFFDGGEIVDCFCFATLPGDIGMTVTAFGVNNKLRINCLMDRSIFGKCIKPNCLSLGLAEEMKTLSALNNESQE